FMSRVPSSGYLVVCADDARLVELAEGTGAPTLTYGFAEEAQVRCDALERKESGHRFRVTFPDGATADASIPVPGAHMVQNATGVLAVAYAEGLAVGDAAEALAAYGGVKRRFDHIGVAAQVTVVDDYAHHPTEIRATLRAARETGHNRVWAIFQPHRYSRTEALATEFGSSFEDADRLVLMDVYSAGEPPIPGVSGKTVVDAVLDARARARIAYLPHRADVATYVAHHVRPGDLVLTMGAGDVTTVGPDLLKAIASTNGGDVG
ncbi:MAG: cyanophycin synthetase, partial [Coriobacteriia bacterium]|nr:cyanophycin synthetase [Coriobacteriia bacterium]